MTRLTADFADIAYRGPDSEASLVVACEVPRLDNGKTIVLDPAEFFAVDGKVTTPELSPGPARIWVRVGRWDQPYDVVIPDSEDLVEVFSLIEQYTPPDAPTVSKAYKYAKESEESARLALESQIKAEQARDHTDQEHDHIHSDVVHVDTALAAIQSALNQANTFAQDQVPPYLQQGVLNDTYGRRDSAGYEVRLESTNFEVSTQPSKSVTWETPDGTGVVVHPSVLFVPNGFAGYQWWAAATPYYGTDNQVENPCVFVSANGTDWVEPPGVVNPLWPPQPGGYNSDTHLTQGPDGSLYLFFRDFSSPEPMEKIMLFVSHDGQDWQGPTVLLFNTSSSRRLMSPAVWWDAGEGAWVMLAVNIIPSPTVVERYTAPSAEGPWTFDGPVTFSPGVGAGRLIWHLDARTLGTQVAVLFQDAAAHGGGGKLYLALSDDSGRTFANSAKAITREQSHYRSTFLPRVTERGVALDMWMGYGGPNWGVKRNTAFAPALPDAQVQQIEFLERQVTLASAVNALPPYLAGDLFNRPNNATGIGVAPSGQAWAASAGTMQVINASAAGTAATNQRAFLPVGAADHHVEVDVTADMANGEQVFLIARAVDGANYIRAGFSSQSFEMQKITSGAATTFGTYKPGANPPGKYRVGIIAKGTSITFTVDGAVVGAYTEASLSSGTNVGLQTNNANVRFDVLTVRSPA